MYRSQFFFKTVDIKKLGNTLLKLEEEYLHVKLKRFTCKCFI